jgi:hypothetical protein
MEVYCSLTWKKHFGVERVWILISRVKLHLISEHGLTRSKDARLYIEQTCVLPAETTAKLWNLWARSDYRHVAFYDVQQLWQFVQFQFIDHFADAAVPQVIGTRDHRTVNGRAGAELPKLVDVEKLSVTTKPLL